MKNNGIKIQLKDNRAEIIDYLKGFSILTIVLMHYIQKVQSLPSIVLKGISLGGSGVHIFFFCSGLGLYLSYLKHKTNFSEFIKKRFLKIYIPYIIIVFISFFCPYMYSGNDRITALLSHVFLFKMFVPKYEDSFGGQLWFISTIIQFYLIFIPLCKIKDKFKNSKKFLLLSLLISLTWWLLCYFTETTEVRVISSAMFQYLWEFSLGMCVAEKIKNAGSIELKIKSLIAVAIVGLGLQAVMTLKPQFKVFNDIPAFLGYGSMAVLIFKILFVRKICIFINKFSYELYLVHILVVNTFFYFIKVENTAICLGLILLAFVTSLILSYFYSVFVKKYILKNF